MTAAGGALAAAGSRNASASESSAAATARSAARSASSSRDSRAVPSTDSGAAAAAAAPGCGSVSFAGVAASAGAGAAAADVSAAAPAAAAFSVAGEASAGGAGGFVSRPGAVPGTESAAGVGSIAEPDAAEPDSEAELDVESEPATESAARLAADFVSRLGASVVAAVALPRSVGGAGGATCASRASLRRKLAMPGATNPSDGALRFRVTLSLRGLAGCGMGGTAVAAVANGRCAAERARLQPLSSDRRGHRLNRFACRPEAPMPSVVQGRRGKRMRDDAPRTRRTSLVPVPLCSRWKPCTVCSE